MQNIWYILNSYRWSHNYIKIFFNTFNFLTSWYLILIINFINTEIFMISRFSQIIINNHFSQTASLISVSKIHIRLNKISTWPYDRIRQRYRLKTLRRRAGYNERIFKAAMTSARRSVCIPSGIKSWFDIAIAKEGRLDPAYPFSPMSSGEIPFSPERFRPKARECLFAPRPDVCIYSDPNGNISPGGISLGNAESAVVDRAIPRLIPCQERSDATD